MEAGNPKHRALERVLMLYLSVEEKPVDIYVRMKGLSIISFQEPLR